MKIVDCPKCGSDSIEQRHSSAEYMSSVTWDCQDCDWFYKSGSGMGVGSDDGGTHPRDLSRDSGQQALVNVGEWCPNCESCVAGAHGCQPEELLEPGDMRPQDEVIEELEEWHFDGDEVLAEAIKDGSVNLTPTFYYVSIDDEHTVMNNEALRKELRAAVERLVDEKDDRRLSGTATGAEIFGAMDAETASEQAYINRELQVLHDIREVAKTKLGYKPIRQV